ncbi:OLC1v1033227C5 [Oldenlandia corymbosa var. corymbosa]|uniref:OLC1v1033227C5 n=1 Tax=Oldenlandia corymbosa var. corymbosa TaxID=529605 RepID=A0AAV1CNE2_OLDCO|nr:OLC1v1033227C5 [Oldenlandia corymbosa var. corymbosa]
MGRAISSVGFKRKRRGNVSLPSKKFEEQKGEETQVKSIQEATLVQTSTPSNSDANTSKRSVNFILDGAAIKKLLVKKKWRVAKSLDDEEVILRQNKNVDDYRCDIVHEALRGILDSPLNKYDMVAAIFVKIEDGVLFEVKPHVRIPRTLERFCGLVSTLLEKRCIRNEETHDILLRVIEEPVTRYLPDNTRIIGLSHNSKKLINVEDYLSASSDDVNFTFVVGASVHKDINTQYADDVVAGRDYH